MDPWIKNLPVIIWPGNENSSAEVNNSNKKYFFLFHNTQTQLSIEVEIKIERNSFIHYIHSHT